MRGSPVVFQGFGGGLNLADAPYQIDNSEARDMLNVVATGRGGIRKRNGVRVVTSGAKFNSVGSITLPALSLAVLAGETRLYQVTSAGAGVDLGVTVSNFPWSFAQAPRSGTQGPLYMSNGVDIPKQWSGTGNAADWTAGTGNLPNARYLLYKGTRMWTANIPSGYTPSGGTALDDPRSAVAFSALGDPRSFPAENVVLFDPNDGEEISGFGSIGPYIIVSKPSKMWVIYDLDSGANRRIGEAGGVASHRSLAESPNGTYFLSRDLNVMVTNGSTTKSISDKVHPLLRQVPAGRVEASCGVYYDGHYYLTFDCDAGRRTLDYDTRLDAWFLHSGLSITDWMVWAPGGVLSLYAVNSQTSIGVFYEVFVPGLVSFEQAYWRGPFHTFGNPQVNKRVRRIHFEGQGFVSVNIAKDFFESYRPEGDFDFEGEASEGVWGRSALGAWQRGPGTWGNLTSVGEAEVLTPGVARSWSIEFGNDVHKGFEVDSYVMMINMRKD